MTECKRDKLTMKWSKRERDMMINFPTKPDGHLLHTVLNGQRFDAEGRPEPSLVDELAERGYDLTTLRFTVTRKPCPCPAPLQDIDPACEVHRRFLDARKKRG